jgi:uncharacterized delta-60 repeat protein
MKSKMPDRLFYLAAGVCCLTVTNLLIAQPSATETEELRTTDRADSTGKKQTTAIPSVPIGDIRGKDLHENLVETDPFHTLALQPGSPDPAFAVPAITGGFPTTVSAIAIQADGKIVIGGNFTAVAGMPRAGIARLYPDGSLDAGFNPVLPMYTTIHALAMQADGKIIAAGTDLARLNPDGSQDIGFKIGSGPDADVLSIALQSDGKILIGGEFTTYNQTLRSRIARLKSDGSLDATFYPMSFG